MPDVNHADNAPADEDETGGGPSRRRYWIGVASRDHVLRGVEGGFGQLSHGKRGPLERMAVGDWLIYYSRSHSEISAPSLRAPRCGMRRPVLRHGLLGRLGA